jgi:hypothetical protein
MRASKDSTGSSSNATGRRTNADDLRRAVDWVLDDGIFVDVRLHGNVTWAPMALVRLAVFWVWSSESSLVAAAKESIALVITIYGSAAVSSYQALTGVLKKYTPQLLPRLWLRLQALMNKCDEKSWRVGLWLALAVDGSRVGVPRTVKNEQRFCKPPKSKTGKKNKGKGKRKNRTRDAARRRAVRRQKSHYDPQSVGPQMWLTLIWHLGLQLPWCWKIGPSYASERTHVLELLAEQKFPECTLFCGDAGFVGYEFWSTIAAKGHHFLVRVGSNVRLLKNLGYAREREGIVYCWPAEAMKKLRRPLVLRLLHFQGSRGDVYLVTNVLSENKLTNQQAGEIYRRRWGIEVHFRALKQTFGRSKLRSRTPACAEVELHWSLIGLWMLRLLALKEQVAAGEPPEKTSIAAVLRIIRSIMHKPSEVPPRGESLRKQLEGAVIDTYERHGKKQSRNYPRRKEEPAPGKPKINTATKKHKEALRELESLAQAA